MFVYPTRYVSREFPLVQNKMISLLAVSDTVPHPSIIALRANGGQSVSSLVKALELGDLARRGAQVGSTNSFR